MKIFLKYVLRSMFEKKGRFLLLLISISMSTTLVFTCVGLTDVIMDSIANPQLKVFEGRDIVINPKESQGGSFTVGDMNLEGIKRDSIIKEFQVQGVIVEKSDDELVDDKKIPVTVRARDKKDMNCTLIDGSIDNINGMQAVISERISLDRKLNVGDKLEFTLAGVPKEFEIVAIAKTEDVFFNDVKDGFQVYIPYDYISKELGSDGRYNLVLATADGDVEDCIDEFNANNTEYSAVKLFDEQMIYDQIGPTKLIMYIMLAVVCVMSALIIYSSFKLTITERMSTIGTFLSQGATVGKVKSILYMESGVYGIFGSIIGCSLGSVLLVLVNRLVSPLKDYGVYEKTNIKPIYIIYGALFAILLSLASACLPVRRLSKIQVKNVILGDGRAIKSMKYRKMIIGLVLIALTVTAYVIAGDKPGYGEILLIVGSFAGILMAYPKIINLVSKLLYKVCRGRLKSLSYAINNLRTSKVLMGNITLIFVSLFCIITISSVATSMVNIVTKAYSTMNFDINIYGISTIREGDEDKRVMTDMIRYLKDYGIKEDDFIFEGSQHGNLTKKGEDRGRYVPIDGIDIDTFMDYIQYFDWSKKEYKDAVSDYKSTENGIMITTVLAKQLKLEKGDTVTLEVGGLEHDFIVGGIMNGLLYNNGAFVIISLDEMEKYFAYEQNSIMFKTDKDVDQVIRDIKPKIREIGANFITLTQMRDNNLKNNKDMVTAMNVFSYLAIIIAALGIINNITISFIQRKTEFAILASVGMDNNMRNRILVFESFMSVTWAMLITLLYCVPGIGMFTVLVKATGLAFDITIDYSVFPVVYLVTLGIVLVATLPVVLKSRKHSIISEIKYE